MPFASVRRMTLAKSFVCRKTMQRIHGALALTYNKVKLTGYANLENMRKKTSNALDTKPRSVLPLRSIVVKVIQIKGKTIPDVPGFLRDPTLF